MPWWVWLLIIMVVLAYVGGSAEETGDYTTARSTQSAIDTGWVILMIAFFIFVSNLLHC